MSIKVIGAGFGRTGTLSLKKALETLGFDKCYHMSEVVANEAHTGLWLDAWRGGDPWEAAQPTDSGSVSPFTTTEPWDAPSTDAGAPDAAGSDPWGGVDSSDPWGSVQAENPFQSSAGAAESWGTSDAAASGSDPFAAGSTPAEPWGTSDAASPADSPCSSEFYGVVELEC